MTHAEIFTIGHSSQTIEEFADLLRQHRIEVLVDVRSSPYSKFTPQFDLERLKTAVAGLGMKYLYLGKELGGKPAADEFYDDESHVLYDRLASSSTFLSGMSRLTQGIDQFRVALMCSEEDPVACHRHLLLARVLVGRGIVVRHIRRDGRLQANGDLDSGQALLPGFDHVAAPPWRSVRPIKRKGPWRVPDDDDPDS